MAQREATFKKSHGRKPTSYEFYILWNAPGQINHPHRIVAERARRFARMITAAN